MVDVRRQRHHVEALREDPVLDHRRQRLLVQPGRPRLHAMRTKPRPSAPSMWATVMTRPACGGAACVIIGLGSTHINNKLLTTCNGSPISLAESCLRACASNFATQPPTPHRRSRRTSTDRIQAHHNPCHRFWGRHSTVESSLWPVQHTAAAAKPTLAYTSAAGSSTVSMALPLVRALAACFEADPLMYVIVRGVVKTK